MQLYMIRHCQSENNASWARLGNSSGRVPDPLLTDIGRKQAKHLAQFIAHSDPDAPTNGHDHQNRTGFGLTHLYSSLMTRAVQTGSEVAETTGTPLVAWEEIHETGGIFEEDPDTRERRGLPGPNRTFFTEQFPGFVLPETLGETGWWNRPFEEKSRIQTRATQVVQQLWQRHGGTDDKVGIITHGGFSQAVLTALLGLPYPLRDVGVERPLWFRFNNGAISRIDFHDDFAMVAYLNRVDYLPTGLIT